MTAYLEKPVKAGALKKQIRTLLANRDVRDALLQTQPEEALRFKGLMPKTFIFRRSKYYTYLTDSLKTEVRAAGTDSAKLGRLHERLGRIVATDPSLELADVFIKLQKANAEVPIISHLQGQLGTLDPAAQNKVREFLIKNPKIKLAAAQAPIPTAPAPMTSKITPGRGPLPTPFQPPATGRGLGSTRECLVLSFRTFLR